ncbi:hypothetical protein [Marinimicrococcus flavescens]|uniref:Uncharacterized protein n=1 Tax=Marinimicrococcus flavescens TaxID=3031815 RepID=A0AAP4D6C9_9PROT|nr:hypothetical protein [Marinimicrococcus flavescens]
MKTSVQKRLEMTRRKLLGRRAVGAVAVRNQLALQGAGEMAMAGGPSLSQGHPRPHLRLVLDD